MPEFTNLNDMAKWIQTQHGQSTVLDENHLIQILTEAGHELEILLKEELENYFSSYEPVEYTRTGNTLASIQVGLPKKISINQWELEITFDDSLANHPSVFGQEDGYTPWLLNAGWRTKLDSTLNKNHFTRFVGTNFITNAVNRFNENNTYKLRVEILHNGLDVTGRIYSYGK